jgi:shikimate kinase/3-dehydroquinate synthase
VAHALDRHVALIGFMGAGKTKLAQAVAHDLGRPHRDLDAVIEDEIGQDIGAFFRARGEAAFREIEERETLLALGNGEPSVLALGGGAVLSEEVRAALSRRAVTIWVDEEVDTCWQRVRGGNRPLAQDETEFRRLYEHRRPLYEGVAEARARDAVDVVLAAGGTSLGRDGRVDWPLEVVADERVVAMHEPPANGPLHTVPSGEAAKTMAVAERLWRELRLDRTGTVVAFGGGCTTDVAGFVAATYLRGVDWVAVPTTLVGQVDAAIGGKTGLNLPEGKNLVGAFHWPVRTLIDTGYLSTLPPGQRAEGMAEVVKTGLLAGEPYWELPEGELVRRCAAFKTAVCLRDPHELGGRAALNLGHTFAHALETAGDFERVSHGEAVALGLLAALRLSGLDPSAVEEVLAPTRVRVNRDAAWAALARDKKARAGRPRLVLLEAPGRPVTGVELPDEQVRAALDELITD